jgi:RimJ/RimL family protein N-acetyltransferase
MNSQKDLETERLILRNWRIGDQGLFFEINSDEDVMAFFPFRRNRAQSDALMAALHEMYSNTGIGFTAMELKKTGECIGFCGLYSCKPESGMPDGTIEIGWRLATRYQGYGYTTEAAKCWLKHGFEKLGLREVVSFAMAANLPSIAVMHRIGMTAHPELDFDHPEIPDTHPHLKHHVFYSITHEQWRNISGA